MSANGHARRGYEKPRTEVTRTEETALMAGTGNGSNFEEPQTTEVGIFTDTEVVNPENALGKKNKGIWDEEGF